MRKLKSTLSLATLILVSMLLFTQCSDARKKAMEVQVEAVNKSLPIQIDESTRFDKMEVVSSSEMKAHYTLLGDNVAELSSDENKAQIKENVVESIKINPNVKTLRDFGITFSYVYCDESGKELMQFAITPNEYK